MGKPLNFGPYCNGYRISEKEGSSAEGIHVSDEQISALGSLVGGAAVALKGDTVGGSCPAPARVTVAAAARPKVQVSTEDAEMAEAIRQSLLLADPGVSVSHTTLDEPAIATKATVASSASGTSSSEPAEETGMEVASGLATDEMQAGDADAWLFCCDAAAPPRDVSVALGNALGGVEFHLQVATAQV